MDVLWRIGDPAAGLHQFNDMWFLEPSNGSAEFRVGHDDPRERWPGLHPGPLQAWTGWEPKAAAITFDLPSPQGWYELVCRLYADQGPCPQIEVTVNGVSGVHFLDVRREDRTEVNGVSAAAGWASLVVPIAAEHLRDGENRITLTTVAVDPVPEAEQGPAHPHFPHFWGSSVRHAGVEFRQRSVPPPTPTVSLTPLPLYHRDGDALVELADLVVTAPHGLDAGHARVRIGDHVQDVTLPSVRFGHARVRLSVPELSDPVAATVDVSLDGETTRAEFEFRPCRKWTLHLLPHVHLDLGYTDYQAKIMEVHTRSIDRALAILDEHPDYAYSIDGSMVVGEYLRSRSDTAIARVQEAFDDGRLRTNAFSALFLTGLAGLEECYRAAYLAASLRRQHGLTVDYANLTDVPSYSSAIPSIVAALGLDAFVGIQNHGRAGTEDSDDLHLQSPFQWEGPDGARVLTFFADCYAQLRYWCGHPPTVTGAADALTRVLRRYDRDDYLPTDLPIVGINSDNEDLGDGEADFVDRWNAVYAYPRLRFSTISDYLDRVRPLRDRLPVVKGDGGSYWEDGVGAGAAIIAAYRRAQTSVATAEAMGALVAAASPQLKVVHAELDRAWESLLIGCEHTWTWMHAPKQPHGDQTVDQLAWKAHHVDTAGRVATDETRRALSQLGELVTTDGPVLLVANPLGFVRPGEVEMELPATTAVQDDDGEHLPTEVIDTVDDLQRVRLDVGDLEPFGYRAFRLMADEPARPDPAPLTAAPEQIEGWRVELEDGRIVGLERDGQQLLDRDSQWAFGEVLYVAGGDGRTTLWDTDRNRPQPDLDIQAATMKVEGLRGSELLLTGDAPGMTGLETRIRFRPDRLDVRVRFDKDRILSKEAVYVAFPFAIDDPVMRYDRQQGWVDPSVDHLPGACNEWFTTQYGVSLSGTRSSVTWVSHDAPLFTMGDVVRGRWPREFDPGSATILSWVMNNYWWTNFPPAQDGPIELRYTIAPTQAFDPAVAARFGREVRTPVAAGTVGWMDKMLVGPRPLPVQGRLLDVDAPDELVVTVTAARAADGLVVRVQDLAGHGGTARVRHPSGRRAWRCTAVEDDLEPLAVASDGWVAVSVPPGGVTTVRLAASAG